MRNFIQPGHILDLTAPAGGIASGQALKVGDLFGVATTGAGEGEQVAVSLEGVFELPKVAGTALVEGVKAYWTGSAITAIASGNTLVGHAVRAVPADALTVQVRISN